MIKKEIGFEIEYNEPIPSFIQVTVPIYYGFDSTNGVKSAKLVLDFMPTKGILKNAKLAGFSIENIVDVRYRTHLRETNSLPDDE